MAAKGYPGQTRAGLARSRGLDAGERTRSEDFPRRHKRDGERHPRRWRGVLGVTARGQRDFAEAQERAYGAVDKIDWPGGFCRQDIGWRAVERRASSCLFAAHPIAATRRGNGGPSPEITLVLRTGDPPCAHRFREMGNRPLLPWRPRPEHRRAVSGERGTAQLPAGPRWALSPWSSRKKSSNAGGRLFTPITTRLPAAPAAAASISASYPTPRATSRFRRCREALSSETTAKYARLDPQSGF